MSEVVLLARRTLSVSGREISAEVCSRGNFIILQGTQDDGSPLPHVALSLVEAHRVLSRFSRASGDGPIIG